MEKYKDIIDMPYVKSNNRPHMSLYDRAAQFAPFSALSGYEESLKETSRVTTIKKELFFLMKIKKLLVLSYIILLIIIWMKKFYSHILLKIKEKVVESI